MHRIGATFIAVCMVLISAALGAVLFLVFGLSGTESTIAALTSLCALALYNAVSTRLRDRLNLSNQIADLSRGTADLARQVAELGRRVSVLEGPTSRALSGAHAPTTAEISELGTLVKQLAETVAAHDSAIAAVRGERNTKADAEEKPAPEAGPPAAPAEPAVALPLPEVAPVTHGDDALTAVIRSAVEANRVDLYLQPIVTLPQRKVRYYEALTRLRDTDGRLLQPPEFLTAAEASGLIARIDNLMLFRCVQVLRRLQIKNREVGLFCNIAAATLNDGQTFPQMLQFMEANRALAPTLMLEFKQSLLRDMGPIELEGLASLREMGFRFCMDQVSDLRMEPRDLADRGVRFVKVPAALLLGRTGAVGTDIAPADLSDLLNRHGISLIADRIENESEVVDLLEFDLRFGQGFLFSPPRPVRAEALQNGERSDPPAAQQQAPSAAAAPAATPAASGTSTSVLPATASLGG